MELFGGLLSSDTWGLTLLPATFVLAALDVFLPLIPSELLVISSGSLSADGHMSLPLVLLVASLGSWLGDLALFALMRTTISGLLERVRWGRRLRRVVRRAAAAAGTSPTYAAVIAGRFISGGRTATVAAAGLARVPLRPFMLLSAIGSVLWASWLVGLGFGLGRASGLPLWQSSVLAMAVGLSAGFVAAGVMAVRRRAASRRATETTRRANETTSRARWRSSRAPRASRRGRGRPAPGPRARRRRPA